MNDLSASKYLSGRDTPLERYSIADYRNGDIAIARNGTVYDVSIAVGSLVAMSGFDVRLMGTGYLITLLKLYLLKNDFDLNECLKYIGELRDVSPEYIRGCILAAMRLNMQLPKVLSALLSADIDEVNTVSEVLEMFGAAYVIYYNYIVSEPFVRDDPDSVINVWSLAEDEQRKKH